MGLSCTEESMVIMFNLIRFETIPERDGRTDGHRELLYQYRASALLC